MWCEWRATDIRSIMDISVSAQMLEEVDPLIPAAATCA